jgi:hypothetical protein
VLVTSGGIRPGTPLLSVGQTVSLLKGGVFALAAIVLLEIAYSSDGLPVWLLLWLAA